MIAAVVFDLDDTLCDFQASEQAARRRLFRDLAGRTGLTPEAIAAAYVEAVRPLLEEWESGRVWSRRTGLEFRTIVWVKVLRQLGLDPWQAGTMAQRQEGMRRQALGLFPDAQPVLAALYRKYPLGLISNGARDMQRAEAELLGITGYFQVMLFEGELGYGKPDPRIFADAAAALGVPAEQILMAGDSLANDVAGARQAGWRAVWVNRERGDGSRRPRPADLPDELAPHLEVATLANLPLPELAGGRGQAGT